MQVYQNFTDENIPPIRTIRIKSSAFTEDSEAFRALTDPIDLPSIGSLSVGIAGGYTKSGRLPWLAIARGETAILLQMEGSTRRAKSKPAWASLLEQHVLANERIFVLGFDLGPLSLALYHHHTLLVSNAVDLPSVVAASIPENDAVDATQNLKSNPHPYGVIRHVIIDEDVEVYKENIDLAFATEEIFEEKEKEGIMAMVKRAWIAHYISTIPTMESTFYDCNKIDTSKFSTHELDVLAKQSYDTQRLDNQKAISTHHEANLSYDSQNSQVSVNSTRFQNRMRGRGQDVRIEAISSNGRFYVTGQAGGTVGGRRTGVDSTINLEGITTTSVTTLGRDGPTRAEVEKNTTILNVLQGKAKLYSSVWAKVIFGSDDQVQYPPSDDPTPPPLLLDDERPMNPSQIKAAEAILDRSNHNITLIQGPPGTGKTSVIAAYVLSAVSGGQRGIWLIAQSNVAVRNIAEKLLKVGFLNWCLLVSKDYVVGWNEEHYFMINEHTIRSDQFGSASTKKKLHNSKVVLCTLSMLSNARLSIFTNVIPIRTLVVDEASQINIGDYLSVFNTFKSLLKLAFIGDDKQLPPFGDDDIKSIFEVPHIRVNGFFLNTQYRMPSLIGDFISGAVYNGELESWEDHPIKPITPSCFFVNVAKGKGVPLGTSQYNNTECETVKMIALKLQAEGKKMAVITPYDAQRSKIENMFKEQNIQGVPAHNVDSYQGNEEDYIIISLVRHQELGFLNDRRRTNVMLTRCKKGMYICTSKRYLQRDGKKSLVGELAEHCGEQAWLEMEVIESGIF